MGTGVSLILIAVGAILTWAVNATVSGLNINTIGVILMVVGLAGLILSLTSRSSSTASRTPSSTTELRRPSSGALGGAPTRRARRRAAGRPPSCLFERLFSTRG